MRQHRTSNLHLRKSILALTVIPALIFSLSACGGDSASQQNTNANKAHLDGMLSHAQSIGVPDSMLQPIMQQEGQISTTRAPLGLPNYYSNVGQRYQTLTVQVHGLEYQATAQLDYQATLDIQNLESALAHMQSQNMPGLTTFSNQLTQDQALLGKAQYPKDYVQVSNNAKHSTQALHLMTPAHDNLLSLQQSIEQLRTSNLDTTGLSQQQTDDMQLFNQGNKPEDFANLIDLTSVQLQEAAVFSTQVIPYVGTAKLRTLRLNIDLLKSDQQDVTAFQQRLQADQTAFDNAKTTADYLQVSTQIDSDTLAVQTALISFKAHSALNSFQNEVSSWGKQHVWPATGDPLDYEYGLQGIGSDDASNVHDAVTVYDYQAAINQINNDMFNLKQMEADAQDSTPWNQTHATDTQVIHHYGVASMQVIVVSLIEQALRVYQGGMLVKSFQITSGQLAKPSLPGFDKILDRESPTKFKSSEPKGSAFWYPDTKINYAMEYHSGGYFFHDSWWRHVYGPGTNFPHADGGQFSNNGSHGCINMQKDDAAWLYGNTSYYTQVIIY